MKRLISLVLILVSIFSVVSCSCIRGDSKYDYDDLSEYINVFGYNPKYGVNGVRFSFIEYKKHYFNNSMVSPSNILPRK